MFELNLARKWLKLLAALLVCGLLCCLWANQGFAQSEFDGKWYFEESLLEEFLPPEMLIEPDSEPVRKLREEFMQSTYLLLDTNECKIEMVMFGEENEVDYFEVVEKGPGLLKIRPLTDREVTTLKIGPDGRLEMIAESGYSMYLVRER